MKSYISEFIQRTVHYNVGDKPNIELDRDIIIENLHKYLLREVGTVFLEKGAKEIICPDEVNIIYSDNYQNTSITKHVLFFLREVNDLLIEEDINLALDLLQTPIEDSIKSLEILNKYINAMDIDSRSENYRTKASNYINIRYEADKKFIAELEMLEKDLHIVQSV